MITSQGVLSISAPTKSIGALLLATIFLFGCAGREAHPVSPYQYGDEDRSCQAIAKELDFIEQEVQRLIPESQKGGENAFLGVAGVFFIFPWFFMDLSDAEKTEINAYRQRYNNLVIIAEEKNCGLGKREIPEFEPEPTKTVDEQAPFGRQ